MALVKYNNNSISSITSAGQLASGSLVPISEQTASGSASIEFTTGIDSTYPIYKFECIAIHSSSSGQNFHLEGSTNGGSSYGITKTTTQFQSVHNEADTQSALQYSTAGDLAQSTDPIDIGRSINIDNDECLNAVIYIFNPSSTTFVKHFISTETENYTGTGMLQNFTAGYFNTISAINSFKFTFTGATNIDSGIIKLYGIKDS